MAETAEETKDGTETEGTEGAAEAGTEGGDAKTFTQAELDKIVQDRVARERKKIPTDYDELKAKAEAHDAAEAEKLSAIEKANKERDDARAEADALKEQVKASSVRSAIREAIDASESTIVDPGAVIDFLTGTDSELLSLDKDGAPTNAAEAVDKLLEKRTYLVSGEQKQTTPSADQGARGGDTPAGQVTQAELDQMTPQEIVKARQEGRLEHLLKS